MSDWLAEWKKTDPYLINTECYLAFLEKKMAEILLYNPTYGSFQIKDSRETLPEDSRWVQSHVAWGRHLKQSEIDTLRLTGKIGVYADEFYLVPKENLADWKKYDAQLDAFNTINDNGELCEWKDDCGNEEHKISINFVPGPLVDDINNNPDEEVFDSMSKWVIARAQSKSRKKAFKEAVSRHVDKLIEAVREVAPYPELLFKFPWSQKPLEPGEAEAICQRKSFDWKNCTYEYRKDCAKSLQRVCRNNSPTPS